MTILGIDPGSRRIGYGVITCTGSEAHYYRAGLLTITSSNDAGALVELRTALETLITEIRPDAVGVERLFFSANRTTAISVSQARGVILELIHHRQIPLYEHTPREVKLAVTGNGAASKQAVAKLIKLTIGAPTETLIDDAVDALAIALTTQRQVRWNANTA